MSRFVAMAGRGLSHIAKASEEKHGARSKLSKVANQHKRVTLFLALWRGFGRAATGAAAGGCGLPVASGAAAVSLVPLGPRRLALRGTSGARLSRS
jgi:hypothetical protein